jgi:DNA recombination protein Rad52
MMSEIGFSPTQKAALEAPLDAAHVKERDQAGRTFAYVEGWRVVEEANRIFGFDGWTRQTVELRCVAEGPRKIGKAPNQRDGFGISYIAKVQVVVRAGAAEITREGVGAGHGIDADCGLAHESAVKEAETDAMKRALMTFGNQFGLALYDKAKSNVVALPKKNCRDLYQRMEAEIDGCSDSRELVQWGSDAEQRVAVLPPDWVKILRGRFAEKLAALRQYEAGERTDVIWDDPPEAPRVRRRPPTIVPAVNCRIVIWPRVSSSLARSATWSPSLRMTLMCQWTKTSASWAGSVPVKRGGQPDVRSATTGRCGR